MNIQIATAHGIQDTSTSLLDLLDYWECITNLRNKSAQYGCLPIEHATGEIQPGDVFVVSGEHTSYYDAIARALTASRLNAYSDQSDIPHTLSNYLDPKALEMEI